MHLALTVADGGLDQQAPGGAGTRPRQPGSTHDRCIFMLRGWAKAHDDSFDLTTSGRRVSVAGSTPTPR